MPADQKHFFTTVVRHERLHYIKIVLKGKGITIGGHLQYFFQFLRQWLVPCPARGLTEQNIQIVSVIN